ncbi:hypothetical protein KXQ82_01090 [Mucilaginibacter sp. HMF5004]|uniref:DUF5687 family protein n=1 Tax=Mucilaginibacter rivuli TaxID=2857527 RepID=UPI001C5F762F|nr:DUF5687 family protein [Mucilaginibacter rivuli]MBW4888284.1 hypothetical protein [Mucilaginibacter rivuli]
MTITFIQHELKSFWRSKGTGKTIAVRIVMGVLILIMLLYVFALGFFLDKILEEVAPTENLVHIFSGIILYYYLFDLLMRFQLQELPTLKVQPYLHLPIKKNTIIRYLSFVSLQSFFNLWPFILFLPFIFKVVKPDSGGLVATAFILSIIGFMVLNNYLSLYIKRRSNLNGWISVGFAAFLVSLLAADYGWHIISFKNLSFLFFGHLQTMPWLFLLPVLLATAMYYINFLYLKQNLYLEDLGSQKKEAYKTSTEIPVLNYFGKVGDLVGNEIKLILRNKRSRSALVICVIMMFYGLMFYIPSINPKMANFQAGKVFCGMFMTGIFIISYGQHMYGWQGSHFDGILVSKVNFRDFLRAKFLLFTTISTVAFLLTIPYVHFGWHAVFINFVMYLWNIGVNTLVVLFFANRNYKRIDLSKGAAFNWEGVGATQLLIGFPLMITPFIIYAPLSFFHHADMALIIIGITGVLFVFTRSYWIKKLEADFQEKRYTIAEGFRNK